MWRPFSRQPDRRGGSGGRATTIALLCLGCLAAFSIIRANASDADGWLGVDLEVANRSPHGALVCQFLLAHWFEMTLDPIGPGGSRQVALLVEPRRGAVAIPNAVGDLMRLEQIHCGLDGTPRRDWTRVAIERLRGALGALRLACDGRACRFE